MQAVYAAAPNPDEPLTGLCVGERPEPTLPDQDWAVLTVAASALNHRDLFTLRGTNIEPGRFPMILGVDAAGFDDTGRAMAVYGLVAEPAFVDREPTAPRRSVLGQVHQGTCAERVVVPRRNLVPVPEGMAFADAACVFGTWAAAYHMLFSRGGALPGDTVLIQGSSGGLASALIALAHATGLRVWATGRTEEKRRHAIGVGAHATFPSGAPLPEPVDLVVDSVGRATWAHSLSSVRRGGTIVIGGVTSGGYPPARLGQIFYEEITVVGAMAATRAEFASTMQFMVRAGLRPSIDRVVPFSAARAALVDIADGSVRGKIVLTPDARVTEDIR